MRAGKLQVMLTPDALLGRTDAPRWVYVKTVWDGAGLLEGRLDLRIGDHHSTLGRYRSGELVLTGGEQNFRLMLPGLQRHYTHGECKAWIRFATPGHELEKLGTELYRIGDSRTRVVSLAASRPNRGGDETWLRFVNSLRFDRFDPHRGTKTEPRLRSSVAHLVHEDFPARPHGYLAYDLAVFSSEAFPALSEAQLEALGAWVAAGGSACILRGEELPHGHRRFLSGLARPANGKAESQDRFTTGTHYLSYGLGRVVIAQPQVVQGDDKGAGRRRMAAFLWRVREAQVRTIVREGRWSEKEERSSDSRYHWDWAGDAVRTRQGRKGQLALHPLVPEEGYGFGRRLLPKNVRVVPLPVIVLLLFLLVALVGPVEYWLLGLARARPLTWIVFPATCLLFTWIIVATGNHYLGRRDHTRVLRILDTDPAGRVLRENRFELTFPATSRRLESPLQNTVFATMDVHRFVGRRDHYSHRFAVATEAPLPLHGGRYPERYAVTTELKQWRPVLTRQFLIGTGETAPWKLPRNPRLDEEKGWEKAHALFARQNPAFDGAVYLVGQGRVFASNLAALSVHRDHAARDPFTGDRPVEPAVEAQDVDTYFGRRSSVDPVALSVSPGFGFFSIVSQLSPNGGRTLEDLHVLDRTDKSSRLWITVTEDGDTITMVRALYKETEHGIR